MGTRNLTAVFVDGEYKIAQYGQWDGYPEGQGLTCLKFAWNVLANKENRKAFADKVRSCSWITQEEIDRRNAMIKSGEVKDWTKVWPELSRDTCADILALVAKSENGLLLNNNITFAADSLFCEWAWVIDLDAGTFEGYRGFNQTTDLTPEDRFYFLVDKQKGEYNAIILAAKWSLDDLPGKDAFLAAFKEEDDE